jgi:predicted nucleic acid-binding protein
VPELHFWVDDLAPLTRLRSNDLMIAAIARSRDLTVVTGNRREFERVVGLRVDDWHEP